MVSVKLFPVQSDIVTFSCFRHVDFRHVFSCYDNACDGKLLRCSCLYCSPPPLLDGALDRTRSFPGAAYALVRRAVEHIGGAAVRDADAWEADGGTDGGASGDAVAGVS